MKIHNNKNGFTLIELIIVMVILGIMAAVAVPRYLDSIANAEASAEDAVISAIRNGLKQYANNSLVERGRATWPENAFDALSEKPIGYSPENRKPNTDGEWTFRMQDAAGGGEIMHQRADNTRWKWQYYYGITDVQGNNTDGAFVDADNAKVGSIGPREQIFND